MAFDKVTFSAQPKKMSSKSDRTWDIVLGTQELPPDEAAVLMGFMHDQIFVMLARNPITDEEAEGFEPPPDFPEVKTKSPSKRLRDVLYRIWEAKGKPGDFEGAFYPLYMERLIDKEKEVLSGLDEGSL